MQAGRSSFEIANSGANGLILSRGKTATRDIGELVVTRRSRSLPGRHRNSMCENREIPLSPALKGRRPMGESDEL
jgi:hypothetical protein